MDPSTYWDSRQVADQLANEGANELQSSEIFVPFTDLRTYFKQVMWIRIQITITQESRYKGIKYLENFYYGESKKPWFSEFNEERYFITFINRLRADHYNLGKSLQRKNYIDSARCKCGYEMEDIDHSMAVQ